MIVEATFKVRPRPERESAVVVACRTRRRGGRRRARGARRASTRCGSRWLAREGCADGPGRRRRRSRSGVGGIAAEVEHGCARCAAVAAGARLPAATVDDGAAFRARLAEFDGEPAAAVLRAATLPTEVGAVLEAAEAAARAARRRRCARWRTPRTASCASPWRAPSTSRRSCRRCARASRPSGGSLVVHRAAPEVKASVDVWGDVGPGRDAHAPHQAGVRPGGVFAPGRFVGGL